MNEFQVVILDHNMNLLDRGLVYADNEIATKEAAKFNRMFHKHCIHGMKAYVQEFKGF